MVCLSTRCTSSHPSGFNFTLTPSIYREQFIENEMQFCFLALYYSHDWLKCGPVYNAITYRKRGSRNSFNINMLPRADLEVVSGLDQGRGPVVAHQCNEKRHVSESKNRSQMEIQKSLYSASLNRQSLH
jgi:hypothetical protein